MPLRYSIDDDTLVLRGNASTREEALLINDGVVTDEVLTLFSESENLLDEEMIPSWNRGQPKFKNFLRLVMDLLEDTKQFLDTFDKHWIVDDACGKQLDIIGELVGVSRLLPFSPMSASRILSDDDFRMLIRAKIASITWDGSNQQAIDLFARLFPNYGLVLEDRQDGTYHIIISTISEISELHLEMLNAGLLLPRPAGIGLSVDIPQSITKTNIIVQAGIYEIGRIDIRQSASGLE